ncbi:ATP-binding cassette domain-containing protein, partial [Aeromonas veronii]|uniref:ATP-binding cassette domain-containing protein n=1 Tax=Aeromonas veronii TaxID=654 RepID=UPI0038B4DDB4
TYGEVRAVAGISFTAADGRVTGFLCPNGAGKCTTMRMMAGLERPDVGTCTVGGSSPLVGHSEFGHMGDHQ